MPRGREGLLRPTDKESGASLSSNSVREMYRLSLREKDPGPRLLHAERESMCGGADQSSNQVVRNAKA